MTFRDKNSHLPNPIWLLLYFLAASVEVLAAVIYLSSIPADPKNSVLWGFSLLRLLMIGGMLLVFLVVAGLSVWVFQNLQKSAVIFGRLCAGRLYSVILFLAAALFILAWVTCLTPSYWFGTWGAYLERLRPPMVWLLLASFQTLALFLLPGRAIRQASFIQPSQEISGRVWHEQGKVLRASGVAAGLLLLLWGFIALTRLGIKPDPLSWNEPGVPVLGLQVMLAWIVGFGLILLETRNPFKGSSSKRLARMDWMVFFAIWVAAALAWNLTPFHGSFFAPGPYPPSNEFYPFSDAAKYDVAAQFALIGQGLNNFNFTDKPLLSAFLYWLHILVGQRYDWLVALQVCALAVFPAVLYLLGKLFHSRPAGVMLAIFSICIEANAITASQWLLTSNTRLLLSEVPTAVGLLLFIYCLVQWLRQPDRQTLYPLLAGGVLGLMTLVRHNPWLLLPAALGMALLVYWRKWRSYLRASLLFLLAMFIAIAPWMWRSYQANRTPFYFMIPLENSVFANRYGIVVSTPEPGAPIKQPTATPAPTLTPVASAFTTPQPTRTPLPASAKALKEFNHALVRFGNILNFSSAHFFHNLYTSALILPTSLVYDDLEHTLTSPQSYWGAKWQDKFSPGAGLLFAVNLLLIGMGIGWSWQRFRMAGLVPLATALSYYLSNALARTSGGRYIVPADWVVYFYYVLGLVQLTWWIVGLVMPGRVRQQIDLPALVPPVKPAAHTRWSVVVLSCFFLIGASLKLGDNLFSRVFIISETKTQILENELPVGSLAQLGVQDSQLAAFLQDKNSVVLVGRVLYPRYYQAGQGEEDLFSQNAKRPYRRMVFNLIGYRANKGVVLPMNKAPDYFPQGADAVVLGCTSKYGVEAHSVVFFRPEIKIYRSEPALPLACPLPYP
jgi:hypothetical protein